MYHDTSRFHSILWENGIGLFLDHTTKTSLMFLFASILHAFVVLCWNVCFTLFYVIEHIPNWFLFQENINSLSDKEKKLLFLADMGYTVEEASIAMDRCGAWLELCWFDSGVACLCANHVWKWILFLFFSFPFWVTFSLFLFGTWNQT